MAFTDDNGGFAFSCDDAKLSIAASTWNTRLSQLARVQGPLRVMTRLLPNLDYIGRIVSKRPHNIYILASTEAEVDARSLKAQFPSIRIALHPNLNAKAVLVGPDTVWISSADFGESKKIESAVGLHSETVFNKALSSLFNPAWATAREI
ncbi:hypothetical protein [Pseudorhodoferax sp. Leaf265]|uniref:hypothetical protein n=1 Tax=Pseudorhodoferax sp. Leaf265 TaxID=1736315 RepID=UPI0006FC8246|nr:hypothetical protein [Pseudorhodoferax sp. Leaf265]KQP21471.1 hypothetical protein ASF45_04175 [Pseudorhodoferax sp. Leaf265]